jgi:hypothetical protein
MKAKIASLVLLALFMLPCSLLGQHYILPENMRSGSSVYHQRITGHTHITFTLNRLTNIKSFLVIVSGTGGSSNINVSVNPAIEAIYNQQVPNGGNYTFAAENMPAGAYLITITRSGTVPDTSPLNVTVICIGDELSAPTGLESPASSYYPDAVMFGASGYNHIKWTYTINNKWS